MLKKSLKPFKRKVNIVYIIRHMTVALLVALLYLLILSGLSFIAPIMKFSEYVIYGIAIIFMTAIIISLVRLPSWEYVAGLVDRDGLNERVQTALELEGREDIYSRIQRDDAIEALEKASLESIKLSIPRVQIYIAIGLVIAIVVLFFMPNPKREIVRLKKDAQRSLGEMADKLEDELSGAESLSEEEREKIREIVDKLFEEIAKNEELKMKTAKISNAQDELARAMQEIRADRMMALAHALEGEGVARELAQAIKNDDRVAMTDEIDSLKEGLEEMSLEEEMTDALSEALRDAAKELSSTDLSKELISLANALSNYDKDNIDNILEKLEGFENSLSANMGESPLQELGDLEYLMQQMKDDILDVENALAQLSGSDDKEGENMIPGGQGEDINHGQGGQDMGSGQDEGAGVGQDGIGGGHIDSTKEPEELGNQSGRPENIEGTPTDDGRVDTIEIEGGIEGEVESIPYKQVIGSYKSQAMEVIDRRRLPSGMEDIVREYFNMLEE